MNLDCDLNGLNPQCFIQPADIEKIERVVDEALAQAAENLAQLEHIHEVKAAVDPTNCTLFVERYRHYFLSRKIFLFAKEKKLIKKLSVL